MYVEVPNVFRQAGGRPFVLQNLLGTSLKVEKSLEGGVLTPVMYLSPERSLYRMVFFTEDGDHEPLGTSLGRRLVAAVATAAGIEYKGLLDKVRSFNACDYACSCKFVCLAQYAGRLQYKDLHIYEALKTLLYIADKEFFYESLVCEILDVKRKVDRGFTKDGIRYKPGELALWVRLNGGSDLDWYSDHYSPISYFEALVANDIMFFDYTKDYRRMVQYIEGSTFPSNYKLTFSAGSRDKWTKNVLSMQGGNVAAVFREFPDIHDDPALDLVGEIGYTLVDGTTNDSRGLDPSGSLVCLKPLGHPAKRDKNSRFMFDNLTEFVQRVGYNA
ncbi:MAG TPA: hypothetical protein EYQ05_02855 [Gammaproteobacteria bacterium]|nr:hypothetical protein [Gammaproteobacteria bacterium]